MSTKDDNNDVKLESFLKANAPRVPDAPPGELKDLLRRLEREGRATPSRRRLPALFPGLVALAATIAVVFGVLHWSSSPSKPELAEEEVAELLVFAYSELNGVVDAEDASGISEGYEALSEHYN